jgi:hypothetical protein
MAFWNRKKMLDLIKTFLENNNATYTVSNNEVSFEIHFNKNDFTIYPYLKVNEENGTLILNINIKEVNSLTTEILHKINNFNAKSVYFKAFVNDDNILYLEYNTFANADNIINVLQGVIDSLFGLSDLIDEL